MDRGTVQAIQDWTTLKTIPELRSFLGLVNYYPGFIKSDSATTTPLTDQLKKGRIWDLSKEC